MAYDETLAGRIRQGLAGQPGLTERRMFGGLCFLLDGRMCCGLLDREMIVRVARQEYEATLREPHVRVMDFTGRPMKGFVNVTAEGLRTPAALRRWIARGVAVARSEPARRPRSTAASRSVRGGRL